MSGNRQKVLFQKFEKASRTSWSLAYWGNNSVTKIGSFLFPRRPDCHFWKLRIISLSPKRLWISVTWNFSLTFFDSKIKMSFECSFLRHSQFLEYEKTLYSRNFLGVLLSRVSVQENFSFTWEAFSSRRVLHHTSLVVQNFLSGPSRIISLILQMRRKKEGPFIGRAIYRL